MFRLRAFYDLSKAFDVVKHELLLHKLEDYGIRGQSLNLFQSYLSNRSQIVMSGTNMSSVYPVSYGVLQGSILGPVLFIVYLNDIVYDFEDGVNPACFANHTSLIIRCQKDAEVEASMAQTKLVNWFNCIDKTQKLYFNTTKMGECKISAKILGVYLDDTLG